jgi:hypothetical protein
MTFQKKFPKLCRVAYRANGTSEPVFGMVIDHVTRDTSLKPYARILLDGASRVTIAWPFELRKLRKVLRKVADKRAPTF